VRTRTTGTMYNHLDCDFILRKSGSCQCYSLGEVLYLELLSLVGEKLFHHAPVCDETSILNGPDLSKRSKLC